MDTLDLSVPFIPLEELQTRDIVDQEIKGLFTKTRKPECNVEMPLAV